MADARIAFGCLRSDPAGPIRKRAIVQTPCATLSPHDDVDAAASGAHVAHGRRRLFEGLQTAPATLIRFYEREGETGIRPV
ncbi:hypothetical protein KDW65_19470 [Burkholderia cenocepacia]|uniref:hypothetical protein n=1 Tax=Burkholderia cepacia complex TaxID=87882 RepID=UPI001B9EE043|nr:MULTISPECIES: hypothetical protein [Burkholderia cepacia complex]MBR8398799.1 hypothetical protein [Burkholderia cenocepacia]MDN7533385.1 hypothetical protein [Burkholderia orbicola]